MSVNFADSSTIFNFVDGAYIIFLIILLIFKELLRAYNGSRTDLWMRIMNVVIAPLLMLFGLIILLRLIGMF